MQSVCTVVLCLLAFSLHAGSGLKCWSCNSERERLCADPFNRTTYYYLQNCDSSRSPGVYSQFSVPICKKQKLIVNGVENVIRSCDYDKDAACKTPSYGGVKETFCEICNEDGCNGAHSVTPAATVTTLLLVALHAVFAKIL